MKQFGARDLTATPLETPNVAYNVTITTGIKGKVFARVNYDLL
jgi:hypothetical protein